MLGNIFWTHGLFAKTCRLIQPEAIHTFDRNSSNTFGKNIFFQDLDAIGKMAPGIGGNGAHLMTVSPVVNVLTGMWKA